MSIQLGKRSMAKFILAAALMLSALPAFAADPATAPGATKAADPVVATVDGDSIKRSEVLTFISGLPEQVRQMPIEQLFPLAQEQLINNKIIMKKATAANLGNDPEVKKLEAQTHDQIIRNVYLERQVGSQVTQKKLVKAYDDLLDKTANVQEVHARHILVDSEAKAREVIKKLDGGAKFEDLAKQYSTGPSAKNGGDLGYFSKDEMVPEFANAAFGLNVGQYTKDPVKTQFGWHVIQVLDKRKRPEPDFDTVKPQLEAMLRQQALQSTLQDWQKESTIKKFDINGNPIKDKK